MNVLCVHSEVLRPLCTSSAKESITSAVIRVLSSAVRMRVVVPSLLMILVHSPAEDQAVS